MIREIDYLDAKKIVDEYERQQKVNLARFEYGDVDLLTVLSTRSRNVLLNYNECCEEGEELIYISDIIKAIKKDGRTYNGQGKDKGKIWYFPLACIHGLGHKVHDEIMEYVLPHL